MLASIIFAAILNAGPIPAPPQPAYLDAMINWRANKMYGFYGAYYYRYDLSTNSMDPGYPKTIAGNWPGLPFQKIDAAVNFYNGKAFFFSGNQYVRYDVNTDRADPGYPKYINPAWNLPWNQVDAAVYWTNGYVYFFNNAAASYVRYKVGARAPDPGYPKYTSGNWNGFPFPNVGAATTYSGRGYFSYGSNFSRVSIPNATQEAGYPKPISWLPNVARGGGYNSGSTYTPPPTTRPAPPPANNAKCKINGTLVHIGRNNYNQAVYQQWNNVTVELHSANSYFNGRYNQLLGMGYTKENAMSACVRENNLWTRSTSAVTKPTTMQSPKYGWQFSWFGFVGLNVGVYRVVVPGYPKLTRWVSFGGPGQAINVNLENQ